MILWSSLVQILKDVENWEVVRSNYQETATPLDKEPQNTTKSIVKNES